jgi:hypothetical protein
MEWDFLRDLEAGQGPERYEQHFIWVLFLKTFLQSLDQNIHNPGAKYTRYLICRYCPPTRDYLTVQVYGSPFEQTFQSEMDLVTTIFVH